MDASGPSPTKSTSGLWHKEEEDYLRDLSRLSEELCQKFKIYHDIYKSRQAKFRIPSIIISSITGLASFGNSNFPKEYQNTVNIAVGACAIFIAIINSIESYMKIGEIIGGTLQASINFQKLKECIDVELALPVESRVGQGIVFLRQCYQTYEKYWDLAPNVLRKMRFVKPSSGMPVTSTPHEGMGTPTPEQTMTNAPLNTYRSIHISVDKP